MAASIRHSMLRISNSFSRNEKQVGIHSGESGDYIGTWAQWHFYQCFETVCW